MTRRGRLQIDEIIQLEDKSIHDLFTESFSEITAILDGVKDNKFDSAINTALTDYVIIHLVSVVETFCKNLARKIIDEFNLPPKGIFEKDEIRISIFDLKEIKNNQKITVGRIVSREINFQNPDEINDVFSKLFGFDFFEKITQLSKDTSFSVSIEQNGEEYGFEWKDFHALFRTRHDLIHEMVNVKPGYEKASLFFANVLLFLSYVLSITTDKEKEMKK